MNHFASAHMFVAVENSEIYMARQQLKAKSAEVRTWVAPSEAAKILGVDKSTVVRWAQKRGRPFAWRIGLHWRISRVALAKMLDGEDTGNGDDRAA